MAKSRATPAKSVANEVAHQGRVVEVRDDLIVLRPGVDPLEVAVAIKPYPEDLVPPQPGDYVFVYGDGQVEVRGRAETNPNEKRVEVPNAPQQDHS